MTINFSANDLPNILIIIDSSIKNNEPLVAEIAEARTANIPAALQEGMQFSRLSYAELLARCQAMKRLSLKFSKFLKP
jgi:hypothetical protein